MKLPNTLNWAGKLLGTTLVLLAIGCGGSNQTDEENGDASAIGEALKGEITIDGSSTVAPISGVAKEQFNKEYKNVNIKLSITGTGDGFKRFSAGETDVSNASRPIKESEFKLCQENNVEFIEIPVAYDGLTIVVNTQNDWADEITVEQLKTIFSAETAPKTWKDVNEDWPDEELKIYAPGTESGTFDYFNEVVLEDAKMRSDFSPSADDNTLVNGVKGNKSAIGFFGASYYFNNEDSLKALAVVNPETKEAVLPSAATIESGEYAPFSRPLFIYVKKASMDRPEVKLFVKFYLDHAAEMAKEVFYVPLPKTVYESATKHVNGKKVGTHYLTEAGEKRKGSVTDIYQEENLVTELD
ncbi:PstS family phosphate ABC transporter substrate-binding protein [Thalassoroseus pseudoceratinae]|uniref:PstS family phosphate ABC transporter substrate-binding protein n=1 Tax=Thalassoroseus pseudoceratinae TaxID=2713176 RepID=UPI0014217524|nr:PstS family phosphate ABC transporter substrate-binding protein [Thalassoroseus pseudoceratinae]